MEFIPSSEEPVLLTVMRKKVPENSLAVQWLGLHSSTARGVGSIPGWETEIP